MTSFMVMPINLIGNRVSRCSSQCNGLVANLILHHKMTEVEYREPEKISKMFERAKDLLNLGRDHFDGKRHFTFSQMFQVLRKIANIFYHSLSESERKELGYVSSSSS